MKLYKVSKITGILLICIASVFCVACEDQVFNKSPNNSFSEDDVWSSLELAESYLTSAYPGVGKWGIDPDSPREMPASLTDNAMQRGDHGIWVYNTGDINPSNFGAVNRWEWNYDKIRKANVFLENIDNVPDASKEEKETFKAIARYIRASSYADLVNWYSWWEGEHNGVPLITKSFVLDDDFTSVKRASYDEVISFIVKELDDIKKILPSEWSSDQWGKPTKGAAMALKARQLLYAASKRHNPEGSIEEWQKASNAAKAVIDMEIYQLVKPVDTWQDYTQIWLNRSNREIIFARSYHPQYVAKNWIDKMNSPNGYTGWGGNCPTQDLVDTYEMQNGEEINSSNSNYDQENPYSNRELRFYANIVYNGREYRGREVETYFAAPGSQDVVPGIDSGSSSIQPWNTCPTGYWMYKFMDESIDFNSEVSDVPLIIFRLAEVYLNYAEAEYHLGNEAIARKYVNNIRTRVNLPEVSSSGNQLLKDIKYERRVELAFENNLRWNDVRRWETLDKTAAKDAIAMFVYKHDDGSMTYERKVAQDRVFDPKMYSAPIPFDEIQKSNLTQNPGY